MVWLLVWLRNWMLWCDVVNKYAIQCRGLLYRCHWTCSEECAQSTLVFLMIPSLPVGQHLELLKLIKMLEVVPIETRRGLPLLIDM